MKDGIHNCRRCGPVTDVQMCWDRRVDKTYAKCRACVRERARRYRTARGAGPRRGYVKWEAVEDMLDFHKALYEPARALAEAAKSLGLTVDAMKLHITRHGYQL